MACLSTVMIFKFSGAEFCFSKVYHVRFSKNIERCIMWLMCRFFLRNMRWESRLEFFANTLEDFLNKQMSEYLLRNYATYAGVVVCNGKEILCAIVQ